MANPNPPARAASWRDDPVTKVWLAGTLAALAASGAIAGAIAGRLLAPGLSWWLWVLAGLWLGAALGAPLSAWLILDRRSDNASRRAFNRVALSVLGMAVWPSILAAPVHGVFVSLLGAAVTIAAGMISLWVAGRVVAKRLAVYRGQ